MRDVAAKGAWIAVSAVVLLWASPATAAFFATSVVASGLLGPGAAAVAIHAGLMVVARWLGDDLAVFGLAALGLQLLAGLGRPWVGWLDHVFSLVFLPRALGGPVWDALARRRVRSDPSGWAYLLGGLVEKLVIADTFARLADPVFDGHGPIGALNAWTGVIAFAVQGVFDIAGLWHVAVGVGLLAGFPLPGMPRRPFSAEKLDDLWINAYPALRVLPRASHELVGARLAPILSAALVVGACAIGPMGALAAGSQVVWSALQRRMSLLTRLTPLLALHGLMLARSPSLERAAFLQDALIGLFGVGTLHSSTLAGFLAGLAALLLGPPDPGRMLGSRPFALGLAVAGIVLFAAQARPFLLFAF